MSSVYCEKRCASPKEAQRKRRESWFSFFLAPSLPALSTSTAVCMCVCVCVRVCVSVRNASGSKESQRERGGGEVVASDRRLDAPITMFVHLETYASKTMVGSVFASAMALRMCLCVCVCVAVCV